ncbi:MAG: SDR family NAD(P)-dependent oxidoreductase [Schleiferiaceae bacterium]|nr:SDR family NAD(P)-dependent oxidoreductase [Schleiferiaceae bacterium]
MKTILVTGSSSGIGKSTAIKFVKAGWNVISWGRRFKKMEAWKNNLPLTDQKRIFIQCVDVMSASQVTKAIQLIPENFKVIDLLVNNAGLALGKSPIHEGLIKDWEQMIDTNLKGLLYVTKVISPEMVNRKSGQIINIGSIAGKETYPDGNVYNATKFAVDALTRGMRQDLSQHQIRVSQISPGMVETEFSEVRFHGDKKKAKQVYKNMSPLKANDIADLIYYISNTPSHVNVADVLILPTQQASATIIARNSNN